jgi:hypothetical protein
MPHNKFFKKFASERQNQLNIKIERAYGKESQYTKIMKTVGVNQPFKAKFGEFLKEQNIYRNRNP